MSPHGIAHHLTPGRLKKVASSNRLVESFYDLRVWQESVELAKDIELIYDQRGILNQRHFDLKRTIKLSAVELPTKIARGRAAKSRTGYRTSVTDAAKTLEELRSKISISHELGIVQARKAEPVIDRMNKLQGMLSSLRRKLS